MGNDFHVKSPEGISVNLLVLSHSHLYKTILNHSKPIKLPSQISCFRSNYQRVNPIKSHFQPSIFPWFSHGNFVQVTLHNGALLPCHRCRAAAPATRRMGCAAPESHSGAGVPLCGGSQRAKLKPQGHLHDLPWFNGDLPWFNGDLPWFNGDLPWCLNRIL